jgi:hypothetical protein
VIVKIEPSPGALSTAQLYGVSSALLASNDRALTAVLRQLERFGYDLERLQFIAQDEPALSGQVRQTYDRFAGVVTQVADLIRAGEIAEAREMQLAEAGPLADRLRRRSCFTATLSVSRGSPRPPIAS